MVDSDYFLHNIAAHHLRIIVPQQKERVLCLEKDSFIERPELKKKKKKKKKKKRKYPTCLPVRTSHIKTVLVYRYFEV